MPFLSPKQQCQNTEGKSMAYIILIYMVPINTRTACIHSLAIFHFMYTTYLFFTNSSHHTLPHGHSGCFQDVFFISKINAR